MAGVVTYRRCCQSCVAGSEHVEGGNKKGVDGVGIEYDGMVYIYIYI